MDRGDEMRRFADAMRELTERFVATTAPVEVFAGLTEDLQRLAARLAGYPQASLYFGYAEAANAGDVTAPMDHSPLMGRANPLAPPIEFERPTDDLVVGSVVFGSAYEGPPGHVHGGFVAAAFDELLGLTQSLSGQHGMTGRLTVHYRSPTPLHVPLRLEGRLVSTEGRKVLTRGEMFADGRLTAEAEGLFITIDFEKFEALKRERDERSRPLRIEPAPEGDGAGERGAAGDERA
jgi:acyl-coenzyme A thioesterase PaaI-like protein